jgi:peptidoglycan/xylan/chitin deacetylase (PgdA/CDA1 family)
MIGRITLKRAVQGIASRTAILTEPFVKPSLGLKACIFYYHRITNVGFVDPRIDDRNVPPNSFERQIAGLAKTAELIPLRDLPARLALPSRSAKPIVCLTFDDGFANFYTQALPILQRYQAPATAFVVTSLIGQREPPPFDRWALNNRSRLSPLSWRPMNWGELEACAASELVTIGAHSHKHRRGRECTEEELAEEAEQSRTILRKRLGEAHCFAYSFPYGSTKLGDVSPQYVRTVQASGYKLAVTTDFALASLGSNPLLLPRIEALALDTPSTLRAKALGALAPYYFVDRLRLLSEKHFA